MNQKNRKIFDTVAGRCAGFAGDISEVFEKYAQMEKLAISESKKYKDEAAVYQQRHHENITTARKEYKDCADVFAAKIRDDAEALKEELEASLASHVNPAVVERCRLWQEFGISPTKAEVEALLKVNGKNLIGLRVISNVLQKVKSAYTVQFRSPEQYESDLKTLESIGMLANGYAPTGCHASAVAVLSGEQIPNRPFGYVWDSTALLVHRARFADALNKIKSVADAWTADVTWKVRESEPLENEDPDDDTEPVAPPSSTTITERNDSAEAAIEYGKSLGKEKAEANRLAAEAVRYYAK